MSPPMVQKLYYTELGLQIKDIFLDAPNVDLPEAQLGGCSTAPAHTGPRRVTELEPQLKTKRSMLHPETAALRLAQHEAGTCKPCIHAVRMTADACPYQQACKFCHLPHEFVRRTKRASKVQRERYRSYVTHILDQAASDPASFDVESVVLPNSIAKNPWLVVKLKKRIRRCIQSATSVMAMTDLLIKDLDNEMQEADVSEKDAQKEYENMMVASGKMRGDDAKSVTDKASAKAAEEEALAAEQDEKDSG